MKHLPWILCVLMTVICLNVVGQRVGNKILWSSDVAQISFENKPCLALQKRAEKRTPLPPGVQALWKVCVQNQIHELSSRTLERNLSWFVDEELKQEAGDISSSLISIVQFPSLEARVRVLCAEGRFSSQYCDAKQKELVRKAVYVVWNRWMQSSDERKRLRGFQWACSHGSLFQLYDGLSQSMRMLVYGCTQARDSAIAQLHNVLRTDSSMAPLIALEAKRLKAAGLLEELVKYRDQDPLSRALIDFAMHGIDTSKIE